MTIITPKSDNLIKKTKELLKKKHRGHSYLTEDWHPFRGAKKARAEFSNIFVLEDYADRVSHFLMVTHVIPEVSKESTDPKTPQGIIAEVVMLSLPLADLKARRCLVLEDVQDLGNAGTMIRTADIAGLDGALISEKSANICNQKILRFMQGSYLHLPTWCTDVYEACQKLQNLGVPLIVTTFPKESVDYKTVEHNGDSAFTMRSEGNGISESMTKQIDILAHAIMPGQAKSSNAAVVIETVLSQSI